MEGDASSAIHVWGERAADWLMVTGQRYARAEQADQALASYELALRVGPPSLLEWGQAVAELGNLRPQSTELLFHEAISLYPQDPNIHFTVGAMYLGIKDYPKACSSCGEAVQLDSGHWQAILCEGIGLYSQKQYRQALGSFAKVAALMPDYPVTDYWVGRTLWALRRWDEAEVALRRAVLRDPQTALFHVALGQLYRSKGKQAEAMSELELARQLDSRSVPFWAK